MISEGRLILGERHTVASTLCLSNKPVSCRWHRSTTQQGRKWQGQSGSQTQNASCLSGRRSLKGNARALRRGNGMQVYALMAEGELNPEVQEGKKIKVTQEITVFHAPKHKEGLQLKGLEGSVKQIVKKFQGKELSANLPYRIEFIIEKEDAKDVKFFAHMDASEFEVVD